MHVKAHPFVYQPGVPRVGHDLVLAQCFCGVDASSVFISSYSYISIFLTVLSGSTAVVMRVYWIERA